MTLSDSLTTLALDRHAEVDLAEINLLLAADFEPDLDVPVVQSQIFELGAELEFGPFDEPVERVRTLSRLLFSDLGFSGDSETYDDPRNSYLNEVLERKLGLPIALSVLAIAVGEAAGLTIAGVGLPGHFIAKLIDGPTEVLFDPFHGGRILTHRDCERLASNATGRPFHATRDALEATPPGIIVQRMLNNLKSSYLRRSMFDEAAAIIGWLGELLPNEPEHIRDLGFAFLQAGRPGKAMTQLERYLPHSGPADKPMVERALREARRHVAAWN